MILTNCAACAAPPAHDAPRCVRCKTRYCNSTCQHDHWRRGHKQICKKIHRGGNAEQYHADKQYKEAVAVAVEACAEDTKGQKCYICLEAAHPRTGEGLVRECACGDRDGVSSPELGVAHVSCLADQAKIWSQRRMIIIWATSYLIRGGSSGTHAACASNRGGRAGRFTLADQRRTGIGAVRCGGSRVACSRPRDTKNHLSCMSPAWRSVSTHTRA